MNMPPLSILRVFNILMIAACAALLSGSAFAQSSLTDDAQTSNAPRSADSNFGNNPNLSVSATGNVYIRFNLASTLPAATPGSQVEKATLKLFIGNITSAGKLDVYEVMSAWQESTITANNAPILGSVVATTQQITADQKGKYLVIDITETVRQWLGSDGQGAGGIPNHGIALLARPVDANTPEIINITFDSKENPQTSHEPRLHIHLKDDAEGGFEAVAHDATLTGDGTAGSPLGVAGGAIGAALIANGAVTETKLGDGAVTGAKLADGAVTSAKIASPLSLASADPVGTLSVTNTGGGAAITATGAVNVTGSLTANGSVSFLGLRTEATAMTPNLIGGFSGNFVTAGVIAATIGGGGGGLSPFPNRITADYGTIGGGRDNQAGDNVGSILDSRFATVGGGDRNTASGNSSTVGGGQNNASRSFFSTVGGGANNLADGVFATVPGGFNNFARGDHSFAAGSLARALHNGAFVWADSTNADFASTANDQFLIRASGGVGIGTNAPTDTLHVGGTIRVDTLGSAGATQLCLNALNQISDCSSSLKYKDQIAPFVAGLDLIEQLRPISFSWISGGARDLGFGAEEVAQIDPLLVTRNKNGEVEGVKYDRIAVVLVNAVKEQQQLIKAQQALLESQQRQIENLKKFVCLDRPDAQLCK